MFSLYSKQSHRAFATLTNCHPDLPALTARAQATIPLWVQGSPHRGRSCPPATMVSLASISDRAAQLSLTRQETTPWMVVFQHLVTRMFPRTNLGTHQNVYLRIMRLVTTPVLSKLSQTRCTLLWGDPPPVGVLLLPPPSPPDLPLRASSAGSMDSTGLQEMSAQRSGVMALLRCHPSPFPPKQSPLNQRKLSRKRCGQTASTTSWTVILAE